MATVVITNSKKHKRYLNYRDNGGTPHHIPLAGGASITIHVDSLDQIKFNSHDLRIIKVNNRLHKHLDSNFTSPIFSGLT